MNCIHDVPLEDGCLVCFGIQKADFVRVLDTRALQLALEESEGAVAQAQDILKKAEALKEEKEKRFPIAGTGGTIPWSVAEQAYIPYSQKYGNDQSLERLAERGGFYTEELDELHPDWQAHLRAATALEKLESQVAKLKEYAKVAANYAESEVFYNSHLSQCREGCSMEVGAVCERGDEIESRYMVGAPEFWSQSLNILKEWDNENS